MLGQAEAPAVPGHDRVEGWAAYPEELRMIDLIFTLILIGVCCRGAYLTYMVTSMGTNRTKYCPSCKKWRLAGHKFISLREGCIPDPIPMAEVMRGYR